MNVHRRISYFLGCSALIALPLSIAACGGSSPSSTSTSTPPAATSPATSPTTGGTGSAQAVSEITTNWEKFFSAQTPVSQRVALLQDGPQFQSLIAAQAGGGLASQASAKVTNVTVTSPTQASVTYNILLNGTPALSNQKGTAVLENGTWKVGVASFCGLLSLENGGNTSKLPAACSAG